MLPGVQGVPASTQGAILEREGETASYSPEVGGAHSCAAGHTRIHTGTHASTRVHACLHNGSFLQRNETSRITATYIEFPLCFHLFTWAFMEC